MKRAIRLGKDNKDFYRGETVYFGTKHQKDRALRQALDSIGLKCEVVAVDTDKFGTFSGELERQGSVRETLRKKIEAVYLARPEARFTLASEGSFGPHPLIGLVQSDHEALLLVDRMLQIEIYVEEISTATNMGEIEIAFEDNFYAFLEETGFPDHGIIVKPKGNSLVVLKDFRNKTALEQAIAEAFLLSPEKKVILSSDMRACFNPTRLKVIENTGLKLVKALTSFCPKCNIPGFAVTKWIPGLPCEECSLPTAVTKEVVWSCIKCDCSERKARPDGLLSISAYNCQFCNP